DFLLGYLKRLLPKRPDLKIIITSATIDPQRFAKHFNNAPIIEVSGRTYPVDVLYRPLYSDDDDEQQKNMQQGIADAVDELNQIGRGDILVFLSGERDIRETAHFLQKRQLHNTDILPLLSRLSSAEQNKIFHTSGKQRIILATNIAETSLTVPGIRYVIDTGMARISRYSWRSKMQRLPIEKISQASANQRKGRCGRISAGICIRLYSEEDFNQRAEFTEPEIQRTNLASVILQMEQMQLGHVDDFPFVEAPDDRLIRDGYKLLFELHAINQQNRITNIGKKLARLPIDPKLGRMLIEAEKESALNEALIIVSALAIQDPRERPLDKQQAADEAHKPLQDERSDFMAYLNLWNRYHKQKAKLSGNKLRNWCKEHFLSWMRMREWIDTHNQIRNMLKETGLRFNQQDADYVALHRSLLTGLLSQLGFNHEHKEYIGARNSKFHIFPGSGLFNKTPKWIMAAEIVETSRVYARCVAKIEPEWIEQKAVHLIKYSYSHPHWEKKPAQVAAFRQASLYGLIVNPKQKINYGPIDPKLSREIFIRSALVQGDYDCHAKFFQHNQQLINQLQELEAKSRRQDILVDEETLFQFYDKLIPENIYSGAQFEPWLKQLNKQQVDNLCLKREDLMQHDAADITDLRFPDYLDFNGNLFPLEYHFDPSHRRDGVTLITPAGALQNIHPQRCEWMVPGLLSEKVTALIRSLPKSLRRHFVPVPDFAQACVDALEPCEQSLTSAIAIQLKKMTGVDIPYDAWRPELLDSHLLMNFRVINQQNKTLAENRNLQQLREQFAGDAEPRQQIESTRHPLEQDDVNAGILDKIPQQIEIRMQGVKMNAYPALCKNGQKVDLRIFNSRLEAQQHHREGLRQLYSKSLTEQLRHLKSGLPGIQQLCLQYASIGKCDELKQDIVTFIIDQLFTLQAVNSETEFNAVLETGRGQLFDRAKELCKLLADTFGIYQQLRKSLKNPPLIWLDAISDIQEQLNHLLYPHFLLSIDPQWLAHYPRYLKAIQKRLDKLQDNPQRDRQNRLAMQTLWTSYKQRQQHAQQQHIQSAQLDYYRWMLEEYRLSLFAQELKTLFPVSDKRLKEYWNKIDDA
ncbi:MAG TPA: ATP-dependent RNA helicase HrpA, partial [Gammaproteobacteria bacterium]